MAPIPQLVWQGDEAYFGKDELLVISSVGQQAVLAYKNGSGRTSDIGVFEDADEAKAYAKEWVGDVGAEDYP